MQQEGFGYDNMNAQDQSSMHLYVVHEFRKRMPTKLLTYTFPGDSTQLNFPFRDVLEYGHESMFFELQQIP